MVKLTDDSNDIKQFIIAGLEKFTGNVGYPSTMGVYCCPWSGWISLNFNTAQSLDASNDNCPDFEFVEYDIIEFEKWQEEYDSPDGTWVDDALKTYSFNFDDGDDALNGFYHQFMKRLLLNLDSQHKLPPTLLQFLDSAFHEKII